MKNFIKKTFGGLSTQYLFRQYFFGVAIAALLSYVTMQSPSGANHSGILLFVINAALYPYARFVYETIVNFITGNHVFYFPLPIMLIAKTFSMALCFAFAIFIAPVGLIYLYVYHTKQTKQQEV